MRIDLVPLYYPGCENLYPKSDLVFVIDVFRASSMMVLLKAKGIRHLYLTDEVEKAFCWKLQNPKGLLFGERGGFAPKGFDGGNSPVELLQKEIQDEDAILTTSNGTRAAFAFREKATTLYALSLLNMQAVRTFLFRNRTIDHVILLCAGSEGHFSLEDFAVAAMVWCSLRSVDEFPDEDIKRLAESLVGNLVSTTTQNFDLKNTTHSRKLAQIGLEKDVDWIVEHTDQFQEIPEIHIV